MRDYFHADTSKYPRRLRAVLIAVLVPLGAVCIFCTAMMIFNLREDGDKGFVQFMLYVIAGCVAAGMATAFTGAYITDKKVRRHARYTYIDLLPSCMVYSRYAGEHYMYGERVIHRRLYYIHYSEIRDVTRDPKQAPAELLIRGEIHSYLLASEQLGYHIDEEGELKFDRPELNERHFDILTRLTIRSDFGSTKQLQRSIEYYREQFVNAPEKRPFNLADYVAARPKRHTGTSNRLLDAPSFDRKWR
ncbi:MAG: hypothetical protein IJO91_10335 [Oscillospiraceae bacterium]|nr:hypothetical protein [Oscillospiraceae bacterium]